MSLKPAPLAHPDPVVMRRFAYAQAAAQDGDWSAAAEVLEQTLELAPDWAAAWFALGEVREKTNDLEGAAAAFRASLEHDRQDFHGAAPRLSLLDAQTPSALPAAYVARLFDDYAPRFDAHLTRGLAYRGPRVIVEALDLVAPSRRFRRGLDLGCGTGLAGVALRERVETLSGVDLSPAMIEQARGTGVYGELSVGDVIAHVGDLAPESVDLVVAADVLVYLGDLAPLFAAVARALTPGGLFAFTVEASSSRDFHLGPNMRFAHSRDYLRRAARSAALTERHFEEASTRREAGREVPGFACVWAAASGAANPS